jgi:hypothetical protein
MSSPNNHINSDAGFSRAGYVRRCLSVRGRGFRCGGRQTRPRHRLRPRHRPRCLSRLKGITWNGPAAFTAANQARYSVDFATQQSVIQLNLDSNPATTELEIQLAGFTPLNASHFLL